jgi:glycosyltransferase involved in cell wall biosynthesis
MSKKKLNISLDSSSDNQEEINDKTCLKKLKKNKKISPKKRINNINITNQKNYNYLIILFLILILFLLILIIFLRYRHKPISNAYLISKTPEEEYMDSKEYFKMIKDGVLYEKNKIYSLTDNPKISIIMPVHNGEAFIKEAIISIQNQDLKDIEIIIIDDKSTDNSVNLIKEIMKNEPRIRLYQNEENRGILFTKAKGILSAKGKYIIILDDDDKFLQRDAFTTLYNEAEKYDIDIVEFRTITSKLVLNKEGYNNTKQEETEIISQNRLKSYLFYNGIFGIIEKKDFKQVKHFVKMELFAKIIKQIDSKYLDLKINYFDDYLFFFLLTRNAKSLKKINRIFYVKQKIIFSDDEKINHRKQERIVNGFNLSCFASLYYIEILFYHTSDTFEDKKIVFSQFEKLFLQHQCRSNTKNHEKAVKICNLFLENQYISLEDKRKIRNYLKKYDQIQ